MHTLTHWLFATPWWILAIAGAAVVAFLLFALSRRDQKLTRIGAALVAAVVVWVLAGLIINTPVERARDRTEAMVRAYEASDWQTLSTLVDPETRFANMLKGQDIVKAAQQTHEELEHGEIMITRVETIRDGAGIRVIVRVLSEQKNAYVPRLSTAWRFDYTQRGDRWELEKIEPLPTDTMDPDTILRNVKLPPELADQRR